MLKKYKHNYRVIVEKMSTENRERPSALKTCLEESDNPRMQKYVKILDTPNISAMEWIHRTQEELMDGIVYLEKLKNVFTMNMMELDAAARIVAEKKEADENNGQQKNTSVPEPDAEQNEETTINIMVPVPEAKAPEPVPTPKKRTVKTKTKAPEPASTPAVEEEKEKKPVKKRKTKVAAAEQA